MPITAVTKDPTSLTMTVVAQFPVSAQRLWEAYADPRQLERFWGPPAYPSKFTRHDMFPGGRSEYFMTGPEGDTHHGYWEFLAIDPGKSFEVIDGFAREDGSPIDDLPTTRTVFQFAPDGQGSTLTATTHFTSVEDLQNLLEMGAEEGMRAAMAQIDDLVADLAAFARGAGTQAQILDDTHVRVSRVIRGSADQVWRAHHDPELMQRWLLGPDGWTMPVCEVAESVGDTYRYEWEALDGSGRFGFTGQLVDSQPPHRAVTTEQMIGMEGPGTVNEMTLTPVAEGTLCSIVITYPSPEIRDIVLATGMTKGMEASYSRLEESVLGAG